MKKNNMTTGLYKILRWGMISKEINIYLAEIKADKKLKELYKEFVDYATREFGNGLLNEIKLYDNMTIIEDDPIDVLTEVAVILNDYTKDLSKDTYKVEDAVVDFTNYYADKYGIPNPIFMFSDEEENEEEDELPLLETKDIKRAKTSDKIIFEIKKEILSYKSKLDKGESLVDMIDDVLDDYDVAFVTTKDAKNNNEVKSINDFNFFYQVDGKNEFKPYEDNNSIENKLLLVHTGYLLTINPINMDSSKNYSIVKTSPCVLNAFESLEPLSKLLKKELNFPKGR